MLNTTRVSNRLTHERSHYLLQHAENPVDWYPWGDEAFKKARSEGKPLFISIGYSSCHWCHVMAHESFEDDEVGRLLNKHFVSVKVDREERPDVDGIYMRACQLMTGSGGWPLTIVCDSEGLPFYADTYLPKHNLRGKQGLIPVLNRIVYLWEHERDNLSAAGREMLDALRSIEEEKAPPPNGFPQMTLAALKKVFDPRWGGFGSAPKFPSPQNVLFLLRMWAATGEADALTMAVRTLDGIWYGGMHDHFGGGFCRYSTDRRWLVPHFEKMLSDNLWLMLAFSEMVLVTEETRFAMAVNETAEYLLREMHASEGGFYTAQDADSEGEEGRYYLWTPGQVASIFPPKDAETLCTTYDITEQGNFEGKNIPHRLFSMESDLPQDWVEQCRRRLLSERSKRVAPETDHKILTGLNGLAVAAFAVAGRVIGEEYYLQIARETAERILYELSENGRLLNRAGEGAVTAFADDYAAVVYGLLELYESTGAPDCLRQAVVLADTLWDDFHDDQNGGLFTVGCHAEELIARVREFHDGAAPSANALAGYLYVRLYQYTDDEEYRRRAEDIFTAYGGSQAAYPLGHVFGALAQLQMANVGERGVFAAEEPSDLSPLSALWHQQYRPFAVSLRVSDRSLRSLCPGADLPIEDVPVVHHCGQGVCHPPLRGLEAWRAFLEKNKSETAGE